jgi:LysR family hydrogen peroxide-inducible transcriptional activator
LEEQLDSQLIERDHKTFVFTPLGVDVVKKARSILEQSADLVATASSEGNEFSGELHVGIIPTIAPFVLSELIEQCKQDFPNLKLFLREDTSANCHALLREGQLDMVLLATPYDNSEFVEQVLCRDPFYRVYHPDQTVRFVYLLEKEHCLTEHALRACSLIESADIHPYQVSSLNTLLAMVNAHIGETYLPALAIHSGLLKGSNLSCEKLEEDSAYRELSLVWRKTSHRRVFYTKVSETILRAIQNVLN